MSTGAEHRREEEAADPADPADLVDSADVRVALGRDPGPWSARRLDVSGASGTIGVWRLTGGGGDGDADPWSVVVKILAHSPRGNPRWLSGAEPDHWYYWRREALAYRSGLTAALPGDLRGAELRASFDREYEPAGAADHCRVCRPDADTRASVHRHDVIALWLEDADEWPATEWDLDRYHLAAGHLGRAQGAFPAGAAALPGHEWLSRDWVRRYLERRVDLVAPLDDDPLPEVDARLVEESRRLWADREVFLSALDATPRTLCHFDAHPANFFSVAGETVVTDWSFVGVGPVGEDPGVLLSDALLDFHVAPDLAADLLEAIWDGYATGLGEAGWRFEPGGVRTAVLLSACVRYPWIVPALAEARRNGDEHVNRWPREEAAARWEPAMAFLFSRADEARRRLDA